MSTVPLNTNRSLRFPVAAATILCAAFLMTTERTGQAVHASAAAPATPQQSQQRQHWFQFGRASWYGHALQGMPTANGEPYDMNAMTCAHRTLPLGSLVRITNLHNHRSLLLRVNDRGPMVSTRVVDLSYAAAKRLGFSAKGTARVRIDLVDAKPSSEEVAVLTRPGL